jgi:hypothetical protein
MQRSRTLTLFNVLLAFGAVLLAQASDAQSPALKISPLQDLPMPPAAARPAQMAHFGEFAFTDHSTILVTVDEGNAAYTYVRGPTGQWIYEAALVAPRGQATRSGAILGNVALVGGTIHTKSAVQGAVFVFMRTNGVWRNTQTIPTSDTRSLGRINTLSIGPDYIVIGDPADKFFAGAVSIYRPSGPGTYVLDTKFQSNHIDDSLLGVNPIADGDVVLAAQPNRFAGSTIEVFARNGGVWAREASLIRADGLEPTEYFAFAGNRAFLDFHPYQQTDIGGFIPLQQSVRTNGVWSGGQEIGHPTDQHAAMGGAVAMGRIRLLAGERNSVGKARRVFLYDLSKAGRWSIRAELLGAASSGCDVADYRYFNRPLQLAISGVVALAACPAAPTASVAEFEGRVRVYELPPWRDDQP